MAVDVLNTPVKRFLAGMVQGALLVTRAPTSFAVVPGVPDCERWVGRWLRTLDGPLPWQCVEDAVYAPRHIPDAAQE